MIRIVILKGDEGRKLSRYLEKRFPKAPKSYFFKALRQNKIKIDRKKPKDLDLVLTEGMTLEMYLPEGIEEEFGFVPDKTEAAPEKKKDVTCPYEILYEDDFIIVIHKPVGVLSQKAASSDVSATEVMRKFLKERDGSLSATYEPSFVHRLDRNTQGVMVMAKDPKTAAVLSEMIREHKMVKYYFAVCKGDCSLWKEKTRLTNVFTKDEKNNKTILKEDKKGEKEARCISDVTMLYTNGESSLVKVELLTGKSHQIRSQMAYYHHPIVGDGKYDEKDGEKKFRQMLLARGVIFTEPSGHLAYLKDKEIRALTPASFSEYLKLSKGFEKTLG